MTKNDASAKFLYCSLGMQWALTALFVIAPFGFDIRSSWGLDLESFIAAAVLLSILAVINVSLAVRSKNTLSVVLSVIPIVAGILKALST